MLDEIGFGSVSGLFSLRSQVSSSAQNINVFSEITDNDGMFETKYDLVTGRRPENYNEAVLIIDRNNEITDFTLYALGMRDTDAIRTAIREMMQKKDKDKIDKVEESDDYEYSDFIGMTFSVIPNSALYRKNADGVWENMTEDEEFMSEAYKNGVELKIVGIIREKESSTQISGTIGYTRALTEKISGIINDSDIVKEQRENEEYDVFTGLPFVDTPSGDKAEEDAKAEAEQKKRELEEMQQKIKEAAEQMKALQEQMTAMQSAAAEIPDMQTIMASLTPEQQAALAQMTPEEQQTYIMQLMPETAQTVEMPDLSAIISLLPEEEQSQLADMTAEEQLRFLMTLAPGQDTQSSETSGSAFDMSGFDMSSFDLSAISDEQMSYFMSMPEEQRNELMKQFGGTAKASDVVSSSSQFDNLKTLGVIDMDTPSSISIFPNDFESKEKVVAIIADYNSAHDEEHQITYTDIVGMLMSSVTDIINAISYILIAFVAISLIVSSIMIGIITYISVLERTKEIGILRSIGASKKDISRVFNAETTIIGFISGGIGILVTLLLLIPINIIIDKITNISGLAVLPPLAGVILVVISVALTLIAGLFPSSVAAKKDPVVALRTE